MISKLLGWILGEAADLAMAVWLIAGLAVIIAQLHSSPAWCVLAGVAFVGITLFLYFRLARRSRERK